MGLSVVISGRTQPEYVLECRRDITPSLVAELPPHFVTATIRYDPSQSYPDLGPIPRNVTVGFIQNVLAVETNVQYANLPLISQTSRPGAAILDSNIANTSSASDLAWYSNARMDDLNHAFTSFQYGRTLNPASTTRAPGAPLPLALPGGGISGQTPLLLGTISMQDHPRAAYYIQYRGSSTGEILQYATRRLVFRIWVCLLEDGASPSIASNYRILGVTDEFSTGHRLDYHGGPASASDTRRDLLRWNTTPSIASKGFGSQPSANISLPVVSGVRAMDYNDGLIALGVSPPQLGVRRAQAGTR